MTSSVSNEAPSASASTSTSTSATPAPAPKLPSKIWTSLLTNTAYLSGFLTLEYSLRKVQSRYPLVALYTDSFPPDGLAALRSRSIPVLHIPYISPGQGASKDFANDPRFNDCWTKLYPFNLTSFTRIVQLDSDMLVVRNMDELMDLDLNDSGSGHGNAHRDRVFAASHACVCNPLHKPHYPRDWIPQNCAFTTQHSDPSAAQVTGAPPTAGLAMPNGGLQVVNPSSTTWSLILSRLNSPESIARYDFADQSLLGDVFHDRWLSLPYIYNALKTLSWPDVHAPIWRDDQVKNLHYILTPKPWEDESTWPERDREQNLVWKTRDVERRKGERERGIVDDGF